MKSTKPPVLGHVEAYLGGLLVDVNETDSHIAYGGAGRINFRANDRWNVQADATIDAIKAYEWTLGRRSAAVHAYWRNPQTHAAGLFGQYTDFLLPDDTDYYYEVKLGAEAQAYLGRVTLSGQAYLGQLRVSGYSENADITGARAALRYFPKDNIRLAVEAGFNRTDYGIYNEDIWTVAAQADYRFDKSPFSAFARYQLDRIDFTGESWINLHKLQLGLRYSFGSNSLFAEDRHGATMDTFRPNYGLPPT